MGKVSEQWDFTRAVAKLLIVAEGLGYMVTFGEAWRPQWVADEYARQGKGTAKSKHTERLAVDLNLFVNGVYQTDTIAYHYLGTVWKRLDPRASWGGDFKRADGNHFSFGEGEG